jgi:hypothetical protein
MGIIQSVLGATVGKLLKDRCYWAVKLSDGSWQSELDWRVDNRFPNSIRPFDWTLDLVATGDVLKIKELWLFCPPNKTSPLGNTARLPITEPGTAFQFKTASVHGFATDNKVIEAQIIGRVTNKETGECECFIWDYQLNCMSQPYKTSIYNFSSWRDGIVAPGLLSVEALGIRV